MLSIIPSHVKRTANSVADCLANEAVEKEDDYSSWRDQDPKPSDILRRCQTLASRDLPPPDGVTHDQPENMWMPVGTPIHGIDR